MKYDKTGFSPDNLGGIANSAQQTLYPTPTGFVGMFDSITRG